MSTKTGNSTQERLRILGDDEVEQIYGQPHFTPDEQAEYFALLSFERDVMEKQLHSIKSRAFFILQLGYFRARRLFFPLSANRVRKDIQYVIDRYFPGQIISDGNISKVTRLKHQHLILSLFGFRTCDQNERSILVGKALQAARVSSKPIYICRELIHHLHQNCIVIPGYRFLQATISQALVAEQKRLEEVILSQLSISDQTLLDLLLADATGLYEITQLKHEPRNFQLNEMKREIQRGEQLKPLYQLIQRLLPALEISRESVKYYASLVTYYSVYKLKRMSRYQSYLYLLCFAYHRTQSLQDNLINALIHHVRRYNDAARESAKEKVYTHHQESQHDLVKAGKVLRLFTDDNIHADTLFSEVRDKAFSIIGRQKLEGVAKQISSQSRIDETAFKWEHIDQSAAQFKRHIRPILMSVDFDSTAKSADPRMDAISFLKQAFQKGRAIGQYAEKRIPTTGIQQSLRAYLYSQKAEHPKALLVDRYEFWVYRQVRNALEAGDIFCRNSIRYRSFEDDLIDSQAMQNKDLLIEEAGLNILKLPIKEHLTDLQEQLETRIQKVNRRISSGENEYLKLKGTGSKRWVLQYPRGSEPVNHAFFDGLSQVSIESVLHFANRHSSFLSVFEHVLGRHTQKPAESKSLIACLIAWGTNLGIGRMAHVSDLSFNQLSTVSENFVRLETLDAANEIVSNHIAKLSIFRHYNIENVLHSSSDGQKFETTRETINARHSPKYFGLKKGIVSYSLVTNHVPVNAEVIGAHDHESHYVFDLLHNNTTDIQSEIHSTDTHGANQVNFAILHLFGYQFAPRYRDIYSVVSKTLHGFKKPSQYDGLLIKPSKKINPNLVIDEWENIQRIILSLAQKTTTQSIIIRKLGSYARKNKTKRALWEYDNIIRSLYLLDFVDSLQLRRNVQLALNRGESYHKLRRAVSYANFGRLRFKKEKEQQLWNECSRLISNCIIYYNASILSSWLEYLESIGDSDGVYALSRISPIAWQHINFFGRYLFEEGPEVIDIDQIIADLINIIA